MTVISLAHTNITRAQSSVFKGVARTHKTKRLLAILLVFSIVVCGFLYVMKTSASTAKGYKIRTLKNQFNEFNEINKTFQISISNLKSINFLQSKTEGLKMVQVRVQGIEYLAFPSANVVAAK
ncbi:MAG: hypothetical protein Q8N59_02045 [bacterium]|nr:hypothetical protein [bacterium]